MAFLWRVRTRFGGSAVTGGGINDLYFSVTGGTAAAANAAAGALWGFLDGQLTTNLTWSTDAEVVQIDEVNGEQVGLAAVTPQAGAGSATDDILPLAAQGLIRWRTGSFINGRELRGRTFVPGFTEAANGVDGAPTSSTINVLTNGAAALLAASSSEFVIWSPTHGTHAEVMSGSGWNQFASLRSRRD